MKHNGWLDIGSVYNVRYNIMKHTVKDNACLYDYEFIG